MKIVADSNVLIRIVVRDDVRQANLAMKAVRDADEIAISLPALCEFVWVLDQAYNRPRSEIGRTIREIIADPKVMFDRAAVLAGLAMQDTGGDFADGVIAFEGRRLGGDVFTTFDRKAAHLVKTAGGQVNLLRGD